MSMTNTANLVVITGRKSFTPSIEFFQNNITVPSAPTRTLTHWVPVLEGYTSAPLVAGNTKLAGNILVFDLPAIHTCMNCADCASTCYAMKAQRLYKNTLNKRMVNWFMAVHAPSQLMNNIVRQIAKLPQRTDNKRWYVRIHSSGDFFSQQYIAMWDSIVRDVNDIRPDIQFYFYTKVSHILDFSGLIAHHNVNMVESVLPDGRINFAPFEEVFKIARETGEYVCPYGNPYLNEELRICGETCTHCMHHKYVLFIKH